LRKNIKVRIPGNRKQFPASLQDGDCVCLKRENVYGKIIRLRENNGTPEGEIYLVGIEKQTTFCRITNLQKLSQEDFDAGIKPLK
jgi:hypothetical protein